MRWMALASWVLLPGVVSAYSTGTTLGGTSITIHAGDGNQTDPHVDGNLVAYTSALGGVTQIRYYDFLTGFDRSIPGTGTSLDFLSDVSGSRVVFTRVDGGKQAIWSFDVSTGGPALELDATPDSNRRGAAIGFRTVAWQDLGLDYGGLPASELVAFDLLSGVADRLTADELVDRSPAVSPDGQVIVWEKCSSATDPCDIWQAKKGAAGWSVVQVTRSPDPESFPDTNGSVVVYGAARAGNATGADLYWTPVAGGAESQLALAGDQRNPNISGGLIAFEARNLSDRVPNWDIYLYDLTKQMLFRLTDTPMLDESLNDVSVKGTQVRVVWSVLESDQNVYGYTFSLASGGEAECLDQGLRRGKPGFCNRGRHLGQLKHSASTAALVSAGGVHSFEESGGAVGCSSSPGDSALAALLAVLGVLFLDRTRAAVTVVRRKRR